MANRDCSPRLCGVLLNNLNCLLDLNITKQKDPTQPPQSPIPLLNETQKKKIDDKRNSTDNTSQDKKEEKSTALVAMETIIRCVF